MEHLKQHINDLDIDLQNGLIKNRKCWSDGRGYLKCKVHSKSFFVHQIIAVAGGLDILNKTVNHKNGIKTDNRICNLECISKSENSIHAHKTGLMNYQKTSKTLIKNGSTRGSKHPQSKLTENDVKQIKQLLIKSNKTHKEIAKKYNVRRQLITAIKSGKVWAHVD